MPSELKYNDETDKSYGLAGTAIALVVLDGDEYLGTISIDAPTGEGVELSPHFFFSGNPRLSAKIAWNELVKHLQLSAAMVMANVMCRSYVQHRRKLSSDTLHALRKFVRSEAEAQCQLDDDECRLLFDKTFGYFDRLFSYTAVHDVTHAFADTLRRQRTLSAQEVVEQLRQLSMML